MNVLYIHDTILLLVHGGELFLACLFRQKDELSKEIIVGVVYASHRCAHTQNHSHLSKDSESWIPVHNTFTGIHSIVLFITLNRHIFAYMCEILGANCHEMASNPQAGISWLFLHKPKNIIHSTGGNIFITPDRNWPFSLEQGRMCRHESFIPFCTLETTVRI